MSRAQTVIAGEYKLHDEGTWYNGVVQTIEDVPANQYGPQYKFILRFDEDQQAGEEPRDVWHYTSTQYTPHEKNKLRQIYDGVMGLPAPRPVGEMVDPDDLIGRRFKAMFKHGKKKDGSPKDEIFLFRPADGVAL